MSSVQFRVATRKDLSTMVEWAAAEGWNPGLDDVDAFFAADPEGFFVAERDGAAAACISVVNHSDDFAFLGFYICRPDLRGQGIGFGLWQHALTHAGARTVGLDGVADQEANYARSGFVRTGASVRMEGGLQPVPHPQVRVVDPADRATLLAMDRAANGVNRAAFASVWFDGSDNRQTFVLTDGAKVIGFATLRRCQQGVKAGPVVAPDAQTALAILRGGLATLPETPVIIDVPSENRALLDALGAQGFVETFATARMYRGPTPERSAALQAIATMELG